MKNYLLSEVLEKNNNNFGLLRLVAALSVIWGHRGLHFAIHPKKDYFVDYIGIEYEGSLAVYVFFMISGMLISKSFVSHQRIVPFLVLRVARIWPALITCSLLSLLLIGPIASGGHALEFYNSPATWDCLWSNVTIVTGTCWGHPLIFPTARVPTTWNNPLWTLPLETHCYIFAMLCGCFGFLNKPRALTALIIISFITFLYISSFHLPASSIVFDFLQMGGYSFYPVPMFFVGMLLYSYREKIHINLFWFFSIFILYLGTNYTKAGSYLVYPVLVYFVLIFGASDLIKRIGNLRSDYSYGVYIYGFVIAQTIAYSYPKITTLQGIAATYVITIIVAVLSWHYVEQPALRFAHALIRKRYPTTTPRPLVLSDAAERSS